MKANSAAVSRSTAGVSTSERFEFFCDAICSTFVGIQPERLSNRPFNADFLSFDLEGCQLARVRAPGHRAVRDARLLRHLPDDSVFLNFQPGQPYGCEIAGRSTLVAAGSVRLIDNAHPFTLDFKPQSDLNLFSLRLPRHLLHGRDNAASIELINNRLSRGGIGRFLSAQYQLAALAIDVGDSGAANATGRALVDLFSCVVEGVAPSLPKTDVALMKIWAQSRLSDLDLGVAAIARHFGVSVRTVQSRFRRDGSDVTQWLRETRLDAAMTALRDPEQVLRPVSAIAVQSGFRSVEHFTRSFRARFGVTPVQARRQGLS